MDKVHSFIPIIDNNARVLILGSMPGAESLRQQRYYANSRNDFWKIIYAIFDAEPDIEYEMKIEFVKSKRIAVWDVIKSCYRKGSLDSNITEETANDFGSLFKTYPNIKHIFFNGSKAFATYKKLVGAGPGNVITKKQLTSTSPANTKKFAEKLQEWKIIRQFLGE